MVDPRADTTALNSQYLQTVTIHGREFQQYSVDKSIHLVPVDEEEADRLLSQHHLLDVVFDGRLIFPPVDEPRNILDCGYGAASWAVEVAEQNRDCTVIGVDISPHMKPDDFPENFWPQLDDINQTFTFQSNSFDLVHSQMVSGGINKSRWPTYLTDMKRVLKPGGWVQLVECSFTCQSDNGSITDSHALRQWSSAYVQSLDGIKDTRAAQQLHTMCSNAGFIDIESRMIPLPLCGWSNDARQRQIGNANMENVQQLLSTFAIFPFSRRLGMTIDQVNALVSRARIEAVKPSLKAYFRLYVCIGKKPGE